MAPLGAQTQFEVRIPTVATPPALSLESIAGWGPAAHVCLCYNFTLRTPADEPADAALLKDGRYLYVRVHAVQKAPITANQRTEGTIGFDDAIALMLWPDDESGFVYAFQATPIGTRGQVSSENTAFAPDWTALGRETADGYDILMRIPLDVIRVRHGTWRLQLSRYISATRTYTEWASSALQTSPGQLLYTGHAYGLPATGGGPLPRARVETYGLLAQNLPGVGNGRIGADFAIPFTRTSSILGTLNPDYSNIEIDQQTIAPSQYARVYQEVRPFFSQGTAAYNPSGNADLYTPAIPTPNWGVAAEGAEGRFNYAALSAQSDSRNDRAWVVSYLPNPRLAISTQHEGVDLAGFHDSVQTSTISFDDGKHFSSYLTYGTDEGTNVLDRSQAAQLEGGWSIYSPVASLAFGLKDQGLYYNPADGYYSRTGIAGYDSSLGRSWAFAPGATITAISAGGSIDRYHNGAGALNQADQNLFGSITVRNVLTATVGTGSSYGETATGALAPFTQQGYSLSYTAPRNVLSASFAQHAGHWDDGYTRASSAALTRQVSKKIALALERDATNFTNGQGGTASVFFRASGVVALSSYATFSLAVRNISGQSPPGSVPAPAGTNLSAAATIATPHDCVYFVYGNPNSIVTVHGFALKVVHYFGAAHGT